MYELDCLGDMCPIPIMKLKQCKQIKEKGGQLKLVTDHSCVVESILQEAEASNPCGRTHERDLGAVHRKLICISRYFCLQWR